MAQDGFPVDDDPAAFRRIGPVVLATGEDHPDALTAAANTSNPAPILLTRRDVLPEVTAAELRRRRASPLTVMGGEAAISFPVVDRAVVEASGGRSRATLLRYRGVDRVGTALAFEPESFDRDEVDVVYLATSRDFPDALAAGPLAASVDEPLLLTAPDRLSPLVPDRICREQAERVVLIGGPNTISPDVVDDLEASTGACVAPIERAPGTSLGFRPLALATSEFDVLALSPEGRWWALRPEPEPSNAEPSVSRSSVRRISVSTAGTRAAVVTEGGGFGDLQIEVIELDGDGRPSHVVDVTDCTNIAVSWRPGREDQFAYVCDDRSELVTLGGDPVALLPRADMAWAPDGSWLALWGLERSASGTPEDVVLRAFVPADAEDPFRPLLARGAVDGVGGLFVQDLLVRRDGSVAMVTTDPGDGDALLNRVVQVPSGQPRLDLITQSPSALGGSGHMQLFGETAAQELVVGRPIPVVSDVAPHAVLAISADGSERVIFDRIDQDGEVSVSGGVVDGRLLVQASPQSVAVVSTDGTLVQRTFLEGRVAEAVLVPG